MLHATGQELLGSYNRVTRFTDIEKKWGFHMKNLKAVIIAAALIALAVAGSAPFIIFPW